MAEYIEREKAFDFIKERMTNVNKLSGASVSVSAFYDMAIRHALDYLMRVPASDVVEVKHGYWKRQKGRPEAICSECGREVVYQTIDNKWWFENYCPHCGAKMELKEGAEE